MVRNGFTISREVMFGTVLSFRATTIALSSVKGFTGKYLASII